MARFRSFTLIATTATLVVVAFDLLIGTSPSADESVRSSLPADVARPDPALYDKPSMLETSSQCRQDAAPHALPGPGAETIGGARKAREVRALLEEFGASAETIDRDRADELRARWNALRSARGRP